MNDNILATAMERYFTDWALLYIMGGTIFALVGLIAGWMIWRKYRERAEHVESQNRKAMGQYEEISDQMSHLRAELSGKASE